MRAVRVLIILAFVVVLGVPFLVRAQRTGGEAAADAGREAPAVIIVTPHVEQIRSEFGEAFSRWHQRVHGSPARVDWRAVGGTSEILKLLEAQYIAAAKHGQVSVADGTPAAPPGTVGFDLMLGGGSYEHTKLKRGVSVEAPGPGAVAVTLKFPMSVPAGFSRAQFDEWFGENAVGTQTLYDPEQYWLGTALSGFGIVYNRDVLREIGVAEPETFADLTDPRYAGLIALADPRLSGSVTTTYESILNNGGWEKGWRTLRELSANARYFASSSTKPPMDVAAGDAAAGLSIDFYGRGQAQSVLRPGEAAGSGRVGYVDPKGAVYIDADPVSVLLGGPSPELARRFVEFCMTEEAQLLWQLPSRHDPRSANNPVGSDGERMGPLQYELRRMPSQRRVYAEYLPHFVDQVDPFVLATDVKSRGWRDSIAPMMAAFGIESLDEQREAWRAVLTAREGAVHDPALRPLLEEMEKAFFAMPTHTIVHEDGRVERLEFNEKNYKAIAEDTQKWRHPVKAAKAKIEYTGFFRESYRRVVDLWNTRPRS
ncbi:MAG: extracellular solute-binding protein [Phycisphaeraceae bacterium]|nr:extracellular solute-binding protein [Phycisphaeraceae bacterium]